MWNVIIPVAASLLSGLGSASSAASRAKQQGIQGAIAEEGKAQQDELAKQQERQSGALSSLIEAYRSGLME